MADIIPTQLPLRPALPTVLGNVDYTRFQELLERMDQLIEQSGLEDEFVKLSLEEYRKGSEERTPSAKELERKIKHSRWCFRCVILMKVLGETCRGMSRRLAECPLFRWFCHMEQIAVIEVPSKSTIQLYQHQWIESEGIRKLIESLIVQAGEKPKEGADQKLELKNAVELETIWMDSTALKLNIHFPVDWVLLRDAVRTLMKGAILIRRHGLKHRMAPPESFMKTMNQLAMAMSGHRRQKQTQKLRKKTFRKMKKLAKIVRKHAQRHRDLLNEEWQQTDWTRKQAEQVLGRMDNVLEQLPAAIEQAHERIIRGNQVDNQEKILSLYEKDAHVIVRGKAAAEVEFGNSLLLVEQADGLIVDWKLHQESAPGDSAQLQESILRIEEYIGIGRIQGVVADRQFDSRSNQDRLEEQEIYNGVCPRKIEELEAKKHSGKFQGYQRRRAQTEARIGVLKKGFFGGVLLEKGFTNQEREVNWCILAHNLWVLARLEQFEKVSRPVGKAA